MSSRKWPELHHDLFSCWCFQHLSLEENGHSTLWFIFFYDNNNDDKNNNEVFERPFSIEPKARTTNIQTKSSRHQKLTRSAQKCLTNITLPPPSHTHTHTYTHTRAPACTHTHTHTCSCARAHIFPRSLKACLRELKSIGEKDRKKVSLQLRFEGRQSLSMYTEKGRLFQMEGPMEEKAHCPWNLLCLFGTWKMQVSAEEQRVRDGIYSSRRLDR